MLINVKTVSELSLADLAEKLNFLGLPAVLLDDELKVAAKSKESTEFAPFLRCGARIDRFLPEDDIGKISKMRPKDTVFTSLIHNGTESYVSIICGDGCRLVVFHSYAGLCLEVMDKYVKMSGYDAELKSGHTGGVPLAPSKNIPKRMEDIIEAACSRQGKLLSLPFFDSAAAVKRLLAEIAGAKLKNKPKISLTLPADELVSEGSERDFILAAAVMIAVCLECAVDGRVSVDVQDGESELAFDISCETEETVYGAVSFGRLGLNTAEGQDIRSYMLKLLADANLWDITSYSENGRFGIKLCTPCVRRGEEFMVHDATSEYIRSIVSAVFSVAE